MTPGAARWIALVVPASLYFVSYFHRVAPAVVASDLMRAFAITAASLGTLSAIYPWVFVAMALLGGSLADSLGPRWTLSAGGVLMALGAALFGLAPTFALAFTGRLLVSLGASVILISWLSLAAEWSRPRAFATVSGWTQTVGNAGALVAASPLALLVEALGWRQTFVLIGGLTLLLAFAVVVLVRDRPEALGLPPVNPERAGRRAATLGGVLSSLPGIVVNPRTWPPVLAAAGIYTALITFLGLWGVPYLTQVYGMPRVEAANLVSLVAIGVAIGSPTAGWLSDHWLGLRRLPMAVFTTLYAVCWIPLALPEALRPPVPVLGLFLFVLGFASGALVLVWSCVREVNDPERVGLVVGVCNTPMFIGLALLQWSTGLILDARWTGLGAGGTRLYPPEAYRSVFALCLAIATASAVSACFVTETRCRNIWTRREAASSVETRGGSLPRPR